MIMLLIRFALPSVRIAVLFCFPFYGHSKPKNPTASCVPDVGNVKTSVRLASFKPLSRRQQDFGCRRNYRRSCRQMIHHL